MFQQQHNDCNSDKINNELSVLSARCHLSKLRCLITGIADTTRLVTSAIARDR